LFLYTAFGIIARTVPRINLLVAGFPLTIGVGLVTLGVALPYIVKLIREVFG
ncbi:MAG: flagellar type III secretion system protein FliR, partial [Proteobacteria bacterium]|nr:flagellar type III secretion system protein FliR [Pseudomonadota bacterium]